VIGKDTRLSGDLIEKTISRNLTACGVNVKCTGTITTPGLAYLTGKLTADAGIMISASHNKPSDNGIKLFNGAGYKLSPDDEEQIEKVIFGHNGKKTSLSQRKGRVYYVKNAQERYVAFLKSTVSGLDLSGIHVALDCAWGAASPFAKRLFTELGARVTSIHDAPSGHKVNDGGAVKPELLQELVRQAGAHIGVAVDGDGDRGILVNEKGDVLDGDRTMAIIARHMLKNGTLPKRSIVASVMSNLGLRETVAEAGGTIVSAGVGDKYVLEALLKHGLSIGGEQSGHIIFLEHLSTPDGLLTALQVLGVMRDTGKSLSELASCMRRFPQILVNVRVKEKRPFESIPAFPDRLRDCHDRLKEDGRILLRYSGTELLARVMVEGRNRAMIEDIAHSLAAHIREEIGIEQ
ncbi:MAG: phosphoglucosamine mutase, partial [Candidatus Omnitrophica bacterium]|nr:phosphoglucosamine mutase [Candidatus Omnitrophota bacterium]